MRREMHADLVRAARLGPDLELHRGAPREAPHHAPARRRARGRASPTTAHALAIARVPSDRALDAPLVLRQARRARTRCRGARWCGRGTASRARGGRRRSSPRPSRPTCRDRGDARCPAARRRRCQRDRAVVEQRVHQRSSGVPRRRMHHQAGRLVEQRAARRPDGGSSAAIGSGASSLGAGSGGSARTRSPTVSFWLARAGAPFTRTRAASIQRCSLRARDACQRGERAVEPLARVRLVHHEFSERRAIRSGRRVRR